MPTRFVSFMNPSVRRRSRRGRFTSSIRRRPRRRRTIRMAVRRVRRRRRSRVFANAPRVVRRRSRRGVRRAVMFRRRRRSSGVIVARRVSRRRRSSGSRRSFGGGGGLMGGFKSFTSKAMIMKATGAVGASVLTSYVMRNWGASLPGASSTYGRALYMIGVPFVAAYFLRRKSPELAEGIAIGALVMGINTLIANVPQLNAIVNPAPVTTAATTPAVTGTSAYGVAGQLGRRLSSYRAYPQSPSHAVALTGSNSVFQNAWS